MRAIVQSLVLFCVLCVSQLLAAQKEGKVFVVSGPSGSGKTTLVEKLKHEFPNVRTSVSYTTRMPRPDEIPDVYYHFVSVDEFEKMIAKGELLEYVKLFDNYYGTSLSSIQNELKQGHDVFLVIDTQGGKKIKEAMPAVFIFISPPPPVLQTLRERLTKRNTESSEVIAKRLAQTEVELEDGKSYEYLIVNDDVNRAYDVLRSILIAEHNRQK